MLFGLFYLFKYLKKENELQFLKNFYFLLNFKE